MKKAYHTIEREGGALVPQPQIGNPLTTLDTPATLTDLTLMEAKLKLCSNERKDETLRD